MADSTRASKLRSLRREAAMKALFPRQRICRQREKSGQKDSLPFLVLLLCAGIGTNINIDGGGAHRESVCSG